MNNDEQPFDEVWDEDLDFLLQSKNGMLDFVWANEKSKRFPASIHAEAVELESRIADLINKASDYDHCAKQKTGKPPLVTADATAKRTRITPEVRDKVIASIKVGRTGKEVAVENGISLGSVAAIKKEAKEAGLVKK